MKYLISKVIAFLNLAFLRNNYAKESYQSIFMYLYSVAVQGMNYGIGGGISEETETFFLSNYLKDALKNKSRVCIFDVGANVGDYTQKLLNTLNKIPVEIHCFEPTKKAFLSLETKYTDLPQVHLNNFGLSDIGGQHTIYTDNSGSEYSSLYRRDIFDDTFHSETISVDTIDNYCREKRISVIDFLKIDVEGNEFKVLQGANFMIANGSIKVIQFEFGSCNISSKVFFADFYKLLGEKYNFFRLLRDGMHPLDKYSESYELFSYANFVALAKKQI